jgi:hypothetical protein
MNASLAVPSWVIPGTYGENLRFLADKGEITTVELLFFIYDQGVKSEFERELDEISGFKGRFSYTAHLPDPVLPDHEELIRLLDPLVKHFIVHGGDKNAADGGATVLEYFKAKFGADRFVLENTTMERFTSVEKNMSADTKICMDTGHLVLEGHSPTEYFTRFAGRISEIHLHGVDQEAAATDGILPDHRGLRGDEDWFHEIVPFLREFSGVINLEVFNWKEVQKTLFCLEKQLW